VLRVVWSIIDGFPCLCALVASQTMANVTSVLPDMPVAIAAFARRWAEVIVGTSYVSMGRRELAKHLLGLTQQLIDAALATGFDPSVGTRVGADLVAAHFTGTVTLDKTLALMVEGLPGLLSSGAPSADVVNRVAQLTGKLAAGYAGALRERCLDEQDAVYRAGLRARREAEQALAASEALFRAMFRAMFTEVAIGICIADLAGNITEVNPALKQMLDYTDEEFRQLNFSVLVHPESATRPWKDYEELWRGERTHLRMEKRFHRSDGAAIWTDLTVSPVRNELDDPVYQLALLDDVSEQHQLQAALRMRVAQLTATRTAQQLAFEQAREEFYRDLHDGVQQTIAAARIDLDGFAEAEEPEEREQMLTQLHAKLGLALEQVHSLKKRVDPPELRFGLKPAIDRVIAELRLVARCQITDADLGVLTLPVYYLVRESLTNVHKHARAGLVEINVVTDGGTIDIAVWDDGIGGVTIPEHGGITGMRKRVEELGGQFEINSPISVGTTVKASIPCASW
jgi:PAS domain S-box-containing protein